MKRKFFTRVGAAVLTAAMLLTGLPEGTALAGTKSTDSAAASTETATAASDSTATDSTDSSLDTYASKRLIVRTGKGSLIDQGDVLARYGNVYLLQYDTEEETEEAYKAFDGKVDAVAVDTAVSVAADATTTDPTDTVMTKTDNPLAALKGTDDTDASGKGVIALIDTGATASGNVTDAVSMLGDSANDDNGHGTAMVKDITAQNPDAKILSIKAIGADGKGDLSAVYAAMEYAISQKVSFINLSITAWKSDANALLESAVEEAGKAGITVIGAAGNDGLDASNFVPGAIDKVVTIGACDSAGNAKVFSNFGSAVDYYADADSTSDAAATFTGWISKNGLTKAGEAKPLIYAAGDVKADQTYVVPDDAEDGPTLNEVVSFYEDDGSGKYDTRIQDYLDRRQMKSKVVNGKIQAPVVFSRNDLNGVVELGVYTDFMDIYKEKEITSECSYDANTGLVYIPEKYKDARLTVRYFMSDRSQMYDYMFTDVSGETFQIAYYDARNDFLEPAWWLAKYYVNNLTAASGHGTLTSEGYAGFYHTTEDINAINPDDVFFVSNGQIAICGGDSKTNMNALSEMHIKLDPRNSGGINAGEMYFLNHFERVLWNNGGTLQGQECKALEKVGERGNGTLKVRTGPNSGMKDYNQIDGWVIGYCAHSNMNGSTPYWTSGRIKCIKKTVNADKSIVEYFYFQMMSPTAQDNAGVFALKYTPPTGVQGRVAIPLQKVNAKTNQPVKAAGFTFDIYYTEGATTSTDTSRYTKLATNLPTNKDGQIGIATGKVGSAEKDLATWKAKNPKWTFLIQETGVPDPNAYTLNKTPKVVTVDISDKSADATDSSLFWGQSVAVPFANEPKWVKGRVAISLQKQDGSTGSNIEQAGFVFDAYYKAGKSSSTDVSDYTYLGPVKTNAEGKVGIATGEVGTAEPTMDEWKKANPEFTFLVKETAVPSGSSYTVSEEPLMITVETDKTTNDKTDNTLFWGADVAKFKDYKDVQGHVGLILQKADASTGKDLPLSGFAFDVYFTQGETTSTDTSKYTKLASGLTTNKDGQIGIVTGFVGTKEESLDAWAKANPKWTFLLKEVKCPENSEYSLNGDPLVVTVDLSKANHEEGSDLYLASTHVRFKNPPKKPKTPTIKTTATSSGSHDVMLNSTTLDTTTVTISDVIDLADLYDGNTYKITGELHNAETGAKIASAKADDITFTVSGDTATKTMTFTVPAKDVANVKTVVYEYLYRIEDGEPRIATSEKNATEVAQTVSFLAPKLETSAKSGTTGKQQADALSTKETVIDTVKYSSLQTGKSYTVKGTLMLKASDTDTKGTAIATAEKTFTPATADGSIDLTFTYDATKYVGKTVVAFEELQQGGVTIATHKDLTDTAQSVYIPSIGTKAAGTDTGIDHQVAESGKTITDTVSYTNLLPETTYKLAGTLVNKATGKEALKAAATFTTGKAASGASTVSGTADVVFTITDADSMAGTTFVAYETLSLDGKDIAEHKDLTDAGQTVYMPKVETQVRSDTTSVQTQFAEKDVKITDTVNVSGLKNGQTYVIKGTLMDKATGKAVAGVTANPTEVKFTASAATSTQKIRYSFDGTDLEGHVLVVFEDLYAVDSTGKETLVGKEEDLQSKTQAMLLTMHGPTLYAGGTGTRYIYIAGIGLAAVAVILVVLLRKKRKSAD